MFALATSASYGKMKVEEYIGFSDGQVRDLLIADELSSCWYVAPDLRVSYEKTFYLYRLVANLQSNFQVRPFRRDRSASNETTTGERTIDHDGKTGSLSLDRRFSRSWLRNRPKSGSSVDTIGPLGLRPLHLSAEPLVDLIFVHGLRGGSTKTWRKGDDPRLYWPQNWLPLEPDFQNANIHSFGYNADFSDTKDSILNVHDFGRALLGEMRTSPHMRKRKNVRLLMSVGKRRANRSRRIQSFSLGTLWEVLCSKWSAPQQSSPPLCSYTVLISQGLCFSTSRRT